jgi:hypothetical protein
MVLGRYGERDIEGERKGCVVCVVCVCVCV